MEKVILNGKLIDINTQQDKNGANYYVLKVAFPHIKEGTKVSVVSKRVIINQYTSEYILTNFNNWLSWGWLKVGDYLEIEGYEEAYVKEGKAYSSVKPTTLNNLSIVDIGMLQAQQNAQQNNQPQVQQPQQNVYTQAPQTQIPQQNVYGQQPQQVVYTQAPQQPQTQAPTQFINNPYQQ